MFSLLFWGGKDLSKADLVTPVAPPKPPHYHLPSAASLLPQDGDKLNLTIPSAVLASFLTRGRRIRRTGPAPPGRARP
jgi:hypothetical protein